MSKGTRFRRYGNWLIEIFPVDGGYGATVHHEELGSGGPGIGGNYLTVAEAEAGAIYAIHVRVAEIALNDWIGEMTQKGVLTWDDFSNGAFPELSSLYNL